MTEKITVRDWVEAMRDGTHTHTGGVLRNSVSYGNVEHESHCALGVLCDIAGFKHNGSGYVDDQDSVLGGYSVGVLGDKLREAGVEPSHIARINDRSISYDHVIDFITCRSGVDPDFVLYEKPPPPPPKPKSRLQRLIEWRRSVRLI